MRYGRSSIPTHSLKRAFSLVELVIVVVIIGVIAAIAVPRVSTAATRASANALHASLTNVRKAVDCYYAEHSQYPGYLAGTTTPDNDSFVDQLLMYTSAKGEANAAYAYPYIYGPYLRKPFPVNPTNDLANVIVKATPGDLDPVDGSVGWVAVLSHGYFGISATNAALDDIGVKEPKKKALVRMEAN